MTDHELREALVWLYAVDCGLAKADDSQAALRSQCRQAIWDQLVSDESDLHVWISRLVREVFLSDAALDEGHGIEEACEFWSWFDHTMWTGVRHVDRVVLPTAAPACAAEQAPVHRTDIPGRMRESV